MTEMQQLKSENKELKEKLSTIENILHEFLCREACYPDGDVAAEMIMRIQATTGDETFVCNPVDLHK